MTQDHTVKNIRICTDILWRVFHVLTLALQYGPGLHYSVDLRMQTYTEPVPLKYGKLDTKYPWIYEYFYSVDDQCDIHRVYLV